jgi:hypothetical protein
MSKRERPVEINISGIPVAGVGGLGLVVIAALMTYQMPEAWLFIAAGAAGGVLLGAILVLAGRHRAPSGPSGSDPTVLFREAADVTPEGRNHDRDRITKLPNHEVTKSTRLCNSALPS